MDGNTNGADLGYFEEGVMASEFENAVRARRKDEIFKVDVPSKNWYYVVKKTHDNVFTAVVRILKVENHE
jgi:parvulin-like peptidyl-prolyl isomerase